MIINHVPGIVHRPQGWFNAFGINNKFANFYSGSLGWVASNRNFFKVDFIDYLKFRGSYGSTGNENVSPQFVKIANRRPRLRPHR
jgi:hypothetical protein